MNKHWHIGALAGLAATLVGVAVCWSQTATSSTQSGGAIAPSIPSSTDPFEAPRSTSSAAPTANPFERATVHFENAIGLNAVTGPAQSKINELIERLRDADELHKPDLVKELEAAVSAEFDEDMKHREAELTKLEERMAKLRTQLERRKKAKAEITQLQTKVIVNEAEGLGFSSSWSHGPANTDSTNTIWDQGSNNAPVKSPYRWAFPASEKPR
jgi:hypothetical protein